MLQKAKTALLEAPLKKSWTSRVDKSNMGVRGSDGRHGWNGMDNEPFLLVENVSFA
jgi:hypothetical protein